jgi:hypothetical protein
MPTAVIVSICSLAVFCCSLLLTIWNLVYQIRSSRVAQTGRLHEVWWSKEMMDTREEVFALCKDLVKEGSQVDAIATYYLAPFSAPEPPGRTAFGKLIGFFCNLEICLRAKLLNEELTCALFGEAHYADYQPLIARLRAVVVAGMPPGKPLPRWLQMTVSLEERFVRKGVRFAPSKGDRT